MNFILALAVSFFSIPFLSKTYACSPIPFFGAPLAKTSNASQNICSESSVDIRAIEPVFAERMEEIVERELRYGAGLEMSDFSLSFFDEPPYVGFRFSSSYIGTDPETGEVTPGHVTSYHESHCVEIRDHPSVPFRFAHENGNCVVTNHWVRRMDLAKRLCRDNCFPSDLLTHFELSPGEVRYIMPKEELVPTGTQEYFLRNLGMFVPEDQKVVVAIPVDGAPEKIFKMGVYVDLKASDFHTSLTLVHPNGTRFLFHKEAILPEEDRFQGVFGYKGDYYAKFSAFEGMPSNGSWKIEIFTKTRFPEGKLYGVGLIFHEELPSPAQ